MVRTIKFNDGKVVPAIGWGNGTGGINANSARAVETGVVALKAGILHIDTAQVCRPDRLTPSRQLTPSGLPHRARDWGGHQGCRSDQKPGVGDDQECVYLPLVPRSF